MMLRRWVDAAPCEGTLAHILNIAAPISQAQGKTGSISNPSTAAKCLTLAVSSVA